MRVKVIHWVKRHYAMQQHGVEAWLLRNSSIGPQQLQSGLIRGSSLCSKHQVMDLLPNFSIETWTLIALVVTLITV